MNASIATVSGSNTGIGFVAPVYWFTPSVEDIVSTDCILRRGKGTNMEDGKDSRPLPGWMGMDLVNERARIWKFHRYLSEVE